MLTRRTIPNEEKNKEKKPTLHGEDLSEELSVDQINHYAHEVLTLLQGLNVSAANFVLKQALEFTADRSYVLPQ